MDRLCFPKALARSAQLDRSCLVHSASFSSVLVGCDLRSLNRLAALTRAAREEIQPGAVAAALVRAAAGLIQSINSALGWVVEVPSPSDVMSCITACMPARID